MTGFSDLDPDPTLEKPAGKNFGAPSPPEHDPLAQRLWLDREQQVKALTVELGQALDGRTAVYLDTCFWIHLRDAQRGELGVRGAELLGRARGAVATGAAIFPVSDMTLFEVLKQTSTSRAETAGLIAELSQGVAIIDNRRRMATEVCHLIKTGRPDVDPSNFHPLHHLVWTRGFGVMGLECPYIPGMDLDQALRIQRRYIDHLWRSVGPEQILAAVEGFEDDDFQSIVDDLNRGTAAHSEGLDSFKTAYGAEADGVADLCADMALDVVAEEASRAGIDPPVPGTPAWSESRSRWRDLIAAGLRKGPKPRRRLRTLHALAALHAAFRWNKGQRFEVNDIYDFEHAAAALAYCQLFLTERPLHHMITAGNLKLDQLFGCQVVHGLDAAIAALAALPPRPDAAKTAN